ncbi:hypothetical protein GIB67_032976 [Kingdonia uniflora]|uniref:J domain-containing protein n=1 Tax=Kingdonia uniflora TaxID=39325 RepID=A0A7J7MYP2_9MAGN|nr:hypothetical protein GIB67_032976 [Kingdonia uniflora]
MENDYYGILKLRRNADKETVKKAWRKLAKKYHPDRNPATREESEKTFKQISEAYAIINNPRKRQIYDLYGQDGLDSDQFAFRSTCTDIVIYNDPYASSDDDDDDDDGDEVPEIDLIKIDRFIPRADRKEGKGMIFIHKAIPIHFNFPFECSLKDLYTGGIKKLVIPTGIYNYDENPRLPIIACPEQIVEIKLLPGMKHGTKIPVLEKGWIVDPVYADGFIPGDLIFTVFEIPHELYKRKGDDLIVFKTLTLTEALNGKDYRMKTLDDRYIPLHISGVIQPGTIFPVPDEGMPIEGQPGRKGKMIIKFSVELPPTATERQVGQVAEIFGGRTYRTYDKIPAWGAEKR